MRKTKAQQWDDFEAVAIELDGIKQKKKSLADQEKELQGQLLKHFDSTGQHTHSFDHDGRHIKVSRVQNTSMVLDEPRLKKRLGAAMWNKISTRMLDKRKLDAHIKSGEIKPQVVAECSEAKEAAPYIKIS